MKKIIMIDSATVSIRLIIEYDVPSNTNGISPISCNTVTDKYAAITKKAITAMISEMRYSLSYTIILNKAKICINKPIRTPKRKYDKKGRLNVDDTSIATYTDAKTINAPIRNITICLLGLPSPDTYDI